MKWCSVNPEVEPIMNSFLEMESSYCICINIYCLKLIKHEYSIYLTWSCSTKLAPLANLLYHHAVINWFLKTMRSFVYTFCIVDFISALPKHINTLNSDVFRDGSLSFLPTIYSINISSFNFIF